MTADTAPFTLVNPDRGDVESFHGALFKVRQALGTTIGINEVRLAAGTSGVEHSESETGHEEIYVILGGSGTFTIDGETVTVTSGDYLRVSPEAVRLASAGDEGLRFIALGAKPLDAFDGWGAL